MHAQWLPEGDMLQLLRRKKGKLSLEKKLRMALATATGVAHLHSHYMLHNVPHRALSASIDTSVLTESFGRIWLRAIFW